MKYYRGINYASRITAAKEQAKLAYGLELKDRLELYGFLARYQGPIGEKRTFIGKHQRKVPNDSDSVTSSDTDDYEVSCKRKKSKPMNNNKAKSREGKVIKLISKHNKAPKQNKITSSVTKKHISRTENFRKCAQNLKSKLNIEGKLISDTKDQETGSNQSNSEETEISSKIFPSQKHTEAYRQKAENCPSNVKNTNTSSNENIMQNSNREVENVISLPKDSTDVDPFEEESISVLENCLLTHSESNANQTEENVSRLNVKIQNSKLNIKGKFISDTKDQETGSNQSNSEETEISSKIFPSQKHTEAYRQKAENCPSAVKNTNSSSNENIMQNSNREVENVVKLLKNNTDVDPFEEESISILENCLLTHSESNANQTGENVSCSNLATVGTYLGKQCNSKQVGQFDPTNGANELISKRADQNTTDTPEADSSEDTTKSLINNNPLHDVPGSISDPMPNSSDKSYTEVSSRSQQHSSNILDPVISETNVKEGLEKVDNESDSDPFEEED